MDTELAEKIFRLSLELDEKLNLLAQELERIEEKNEKIEYSKRLRELKGVLFGGFLYKIPYEYPQLQKLAEQSLSWAKKPVQESSKTKNLVLENDRIKDIDVKSFREIFVDTHAGRGQKYCFQDERFSPLMVVIPAGKFVMGSPNNEEGHNICEAPQHEVNIDYSFSVGRCTVTFEEWNYYTSQNDEAPKSKDESWGRGRRPVINVSWHQARGYVKWLSEVTGQTYRLLSEAEWEYVARAGTSTSFWWGNNISTDQANYNEFRDQTVPVGCFEPNPWGIYGVHGNVWEWVEDGWHDDYNGAPTDGSAWIAPSNKEIAMHVLRGGAWFNAADSLRSASRNAGRSTFRNYSIGFRVARSL